MEKVTDKGKVICQICGEEFPIITPSHLKNKHTISLSIYREKFPDCPITSIEYKARQRYLKGNLFSKTDQGPTVDDIDLNKLNLTKTDIVDIEKEIGIQEKIQDIKKEEKKLRVRRDSEKLIVKEVKVEERDLFPTPKISPRKLQILEFLKSVFPPNSVINNYMIDKITLAGNLEYQIITDISIPLKKIDLEFPKTFWHNRGMHDVYRNLKLERDGWIVIEINKADVNIDDVRTYLEHRKLI